MKNAVLFLIFTAACLAQAQVSGNTAISGETAQASLTLAFNSRLTLTFTCDKTGIYKSEPTGPEDIVNCRANISKPAPAAGATVSVFAESPAGSPDKLLIDDKVNSRTTPVTLTIVGGADFVGFTVKRI